MELQNTTPPDSIVTPPFPPQEKQLVLPRVLVALLIFLLGIAAGSAGTFFLSTRQFQLLPVSLSPSPTPITVTTPIPDPTMGWETYTNLELGFTFKYPKEMDSSCCNIEIPNNQPLLVLAKKTTVRQNTDKPFDGLAIAVSEIGSQNFDQFIESQKNILISTYKKFEGSTPQSTRDTAITVDDIQGKLLHGYSIFKTEFFYIPFSSGKKVLVIAKTEESPGSFDTGFDQILPTFKFLNAPMQTPTPTMATALIRPPLLSTVGWKQIMLKNIRFEIPSDVEFHISDEGEAGYRGWFTVPPSVMPSVNVMVYQYDGGSRRQWWINQLGARPDEVAKYLRFQDVQLGSVQALDVFADGGWWQGAQY